MSPALKIEVVPLQEVPKSIPGAEREAQRPLVLVVDDERVIADTLSVILSRSGFSVMTAYDGERALELAEVAPPDLLLSDVMMGPGMDGTELAIAVNKLCPECKVLLFSGHAATRDLLDKAREAGHNFTLLNKPLHPADLLSRITETFAGARPVSGANGYNGVA
jgi:CheY-like chemotaxis protein